jgi:hypothetical protein
MDIKHDNTMYITKNDRTVLRFAPVGKGLYMYTGNDVNNISAWVLINTVEDHKQEYTKREYCDAVLARKVQNIIIFPWVCKYTKITD